MHVFNELLNFRGWVIFFTLTVLISIPILSNSQSIYWAKKATNTNNDFVRAIKADGDNTYIMGVYNGSISFDSAGTPKSLTGFGNRDFYIAKLNCAKNLVWANRIGSTLDDQSVHLFMGIDTDSAGNIYAIGTFKGTATISTTLGLNGSLTSAGQGDVFLLKYNSNGVLLWRVGIGGTGNDESFQVKAHSSGIFICGSFTGTCTFNTTSGISQNVSSSGSEDAFVAKYSQDGVIQWTRTAGGLGTDLAGGLSLSKTGDIYVAGNFGCCSSTNATFGSIVINNAGGWGGYVAKLNPAGQWVWVNRMGLTVTEAMGTPYADDSGNVFAVGIFENGNSFITSRPPGTGASLINNGAMDAVVVSFDSAGVYKWHSVIGGAGNEYIHDLKPNSRNNIVVCGSFSNTANFGGMSLTSAGSFDGYIAEYSKSGNLVSALRVGGLGQDEAYCLSSDNKGNMQVGGYFNGTATFGSTALTSSGGWESFFSGIKYENRKDLQVVSNDTLTCNSNALIRVAGNIEPGSTISWLRNNVLIAGETNDTLITNQTGIYNAIVQSACLQRDTLNEISINQTVIFTSISSNQSICIGDSVQLNIGGTASSYVWFPGTTLSDSNSTSPFAKPTVNTKYYVRSTLLGCTKLDSVNVSIFNTLPVSAGIDRFACKGDTIQITATGGATQYSWSPTSGISDTGLANPRFYPPVTTTYFVKSTKGNCSGTDTVVVNVNNTCCVNSISSIPANNLLLHIPVKGSAIDVSPNPVPITVLGNVPLSSDRYGNNDGAYSFSNASSHKLTISPVTKLTFNATTSFSFGAWVFVRNLRTSGSRILSIYANGGYELILAGTNDGVNAGKLQLLDFNGATMTTRANIFSDIAMPFNQWVHVMGIVNRSDSTYRLFINNRLSASVKVVNSAQVNCGVVIGNHPISNWGIDGVVDDVRIYNIALDSVLRSNIINNDAVKILNADTTICFGKPVQIRTAGIASQYSWTPIIGVSNAAIANPVITPATGPSTNMYIVSAENGFCQSSDTLYISTDTIGITVSPTQTICAGDSIQIIATGGSSYRWSYNTTLSDTTIANPYVKPAVSTTYYVSISNGICTKTDSVRVNVTPLPPVQAGSDKTICTGDSVQLNANGATKYLWSPATSLSNDTISNPYAKPAVTTQYLLIGQLNNCIGRDTITVFVGSTITADAGTDKAICNSDSIQFSATGGVMYTWTPATGLSNDTIANPKAFPSTTTQYVLKVSIGNCFDYDTVIVNVAPVNITLTSDQVICPGDSIQLTASGGNTYAWTPSSGLSNTTIANPIAKPSITTRYVVTVSNIYCSSEDSVLVSVQNSSKIDAGIDKSICEGDTIQLGATGATNYFWFPALGLSDPNISSPMAFPSVTTQYIVQSATGSCTASDTIIVVVNSLPNVNAGTDLVKCKNNPVQLQATATDADTYLWSPATGLSNPAIPDPLTTINATTVYTFTATNSTTGCIKSDDVLVDYRNPIAAFSLNYYNGNQPLNIISNNSSSPPPLDYTWQIFNDTFMQVFSNINFFYTLNAGFYNVLLIAVDDKGCSDSSFQNVEVINLTELFIPNVFTPNGDNINDFFELVFRKDSYKMIKGSIWNRWGGKIYEFNYPENKEWWDGKINGDDAADGVYFYIIEATNVFNETKLYSNTITLLR